MSWRKDQRDQRRAERGYHHGNLKEALLQAALDLIAQKGAAGFTFADGVEEAVKAGATAFIEPGGSMRDDEVIAAADRLGVAMVFTGVRHFRQ